MTVKNGQEFICSAISSILSQQSVDIEIVVVDDGSTDNTASIIKGIEGNIIFIETGGVGRAKALNLGVRHSHGDYICILDADDQIHPDKTKLQLDFVTKNKNRIQVVFTDFFVFSHDDELTHFMLTNYCVAHLLMTSPNVLRYKNPFCHSSMLIKKDILLSVGGYNENLTKLVDYDLYLRLMAKNINMACLNEKLTYKRFHSKQQFENNKRINYIFAVFILQLKYNFNAHGYVYIPLIFAKLLYSFLPKAFRKYIKNK
ncbi:glycosyltransferase [Escherichia coli]|uniref:glycosyltransferase n=11 Tax=Enterobacterales TaxID=91347 RepID=UPI003A85B625